MGASELDSSLSLTTRISTAVVKLMLEYVGRGPTRARTTIDHDLIAVVLRDTLTNGERRLVAAGHSHVVDELRKAYQHTMHDELIAAIEGLTGRKVAALLSNIHIERDVIVKNFVLEPPPGLSKD